MRWYQVFVLVAVNVLMFVLDKFSTLDYLPFFAVKSHDWSFSMQMSGLYFNHMHPQLHQYFTSTLCHANAQVAHRHELLLGILTCRAAFE